MREVVTFTDLPVAEGFEGSVFRVEGPIADRLRPVGSVALAFVTDSAVKIDVIDAMAVDGAELLAQYCNKGYHTSFDDLQEGSTNVWMLANPLDQSVVQPAIVGFLQLISRHQPTI
jgi:hypothetical protein